MSVDHKLDTVYPDVSQADFLIQHIVLPPELPQERPEDHSGRESALLSFVANVLQNYAHSVSGTSDDCDAFQVACKLLKAMVLVHDPGQDFRYQLKLAITQLCPGDVFAMHIPAQNAGIIFRRDEEQILQFEVFEVSPVPEAVVNCQGRLKCTYPGPATLIQWKDACNPAFLTELISFLHHMSFHEFSTETLATSRKGGNDLSETRSVADPKYIVELFTGMMRGIGCEIQIDRITKSIRDEVNWSKANLPWRRSGLWLVVRVALQTTLSPQQYKCLMLEVIRSLLEFSLQLEVNSHYISCTSKKLARRAQKLGSNIPDGLLRKILATTEDAASILKDRWESSISSCQRQIEWLPALGNPTNIRINTHLSIPNATAWFAERVSFFQNPVASIQDVADPTEKSRSRSKTDFPKILKGSEVETALNVIDFENWVKNNLQAWCRANFDATVVEVISTKIKHYHEIASSIYIGKNILDTSTMILTIMEMWVQLDTAACKLLPLLRSYLPELPQGLLHPLLLVRKAEMTRLHEIERYVDARRLNSSGSSIFNSESDASSFAVKYYDQSPELQNLRQEIEQRGADDRANKRAELSRLNSQHAEYLSKARSLEHEYSTNRRGWVEHRSWCSKCTWERTADNMKIDTHEWPLPKFEVGAKSVVFELRPPPPFVSWRDITYYVLMEVCRPEARGSSINNLKPEDWHDIDDWDVLKGFRTHVPVRVNLVSTAKPISRSHYRNRKVPASESDVLLNHSGQYRLFDHKNPEFISSRHKSRTLAPLCNSEITDSGYKVLEYAVNGVEHSQNKVIAEQSLCPESLTLREYISFGSLRSGRHLQWHNILVELRKDELSFKKDAVYKLILHAACHVGVNTDDEDWRRDAHITLSEEEYSRELLVTLRRCLAAIKENWEQANALKVLVLLAQRLASCGHESVKAKTVKFMKAARRTCNPWIHSIREKLEDAESAERIHELRNWLLRIAGIQCSTFDIDGATDVSGESFTAAFEVQEDIVEYLVCQNVIYDTCMGDLSGQPSTLRLSLEANRRFATLAEPFIQQKLSEDTQTLTLVCRRLLPTYTIKGSWNRLSGSARRWWKIASRGAGTKTTTIHFNVLQGKLLVDGKLKGRVPEEYYNHETYRKLLGKRILDVIPSCQPGMSYQTKHKFCGVVLHFHMENSGLIIRKDDGQVHEFIPAEMFYDGVPRPIVSGSTQWLNLSQQNIVFRQGKKCFEEFQPSDDWILENSSGEWMMKRQDQTLLKMDGSIHRAAHRALGPIESTDQIVVTTTGGNSLINVALPRYKLEFFVNGSNQIECKSLRGWILDPSQGIGTFIGLKNYLKLRLVNDHSDRESVLVPFGTIHPTLPAAKHHTSVTIKSPAGECSYTVYQIDRYLNRLRDDGTLKARYTRLYLHALCSGILPDPLTGRSGVDEALDGLRNATSFSFQSLYENEAEILGEISSLTPQRSFYPKHKKLMMQTIWSNSIPVWVQNDLFYPAVNEIFEDWNRRQFLIEGSDGLILKGRGDTALLERAKYHNSVFQQDEYFADLRDGASREHILRHLPQDGEAYAHDLAYATYSWQPTQGLRLDLHTYFAHETVVTGCSEKAKLGYSGEWAVSNAIKSWCTLYELCRKADKKDRFSILFMFSTFVYRDPSVREYLKSLLAIAASDCFSKRRMPNYSQFNPSIGLEPFSSAIMSFLANSAIDYDDTPYASGQKLSRNLNEDDTSYYARAYKKYQSDLAEQTAKVTRVIMRQWPCESVVDPPENWSLLNVSMAIDNIRARFLTCFRNRAFFAHLDLVEAGLRHLRIGTGDLVKFDLSTCQVSGDEDDEMEICPIRYSTSLQDLLARRPPPRRLSNRRSQVFGGLPIEDPGEDSSEDDLALSDSATLEDTIGRLQESSEPFAEKYAADLLLSLNALEQCHASGAMVDPASEEETVLKLKKSSSANVELLFARIRSALTPQALQEKLLHSAGLWPSSNVMDLVLKLRLKERKYLPREWKAIILRLGELITLRQRADRLYQCLKAGSYQEFEKEYGNKGRENWKSEDHADWLLLEIDSEMLIRPVQAEIGQAMMDDSDDNNAVMQLNMGEGKSAIIVPAVVAALADTTRLVRSIVLKPLSTQMFQILVQRLSGLCDRRIYFLPFFRDLDLTPPDIRRIRSLYENCRSNGDILLALPEHLLSFKLMGLEKLMRGDTDLARLLLEAQQWLEFHTRDVLDESDEILHIRYQLIYTMGAQQTLEGGSDRWTMIEEVLDLLQDVAQETAVVHPKAVEIGATDGSKYPLIRIIDKQCGERMLIKMARRICRLGTTKVPSIASKLNLLSAEMRTLALEFITSKDVTLEDQEILLTACEHLKTQLLILRGLIAEGVLLFVLRDKRYRVDFGLDTKRSRLAVPYRAKDRPALKAEFGHPEVVLTLTCLTYYYGGLADSNLRDCFDLLLKTDDPDLTYESWTRRSTAVPDTLKNLRGLNLLDQDQLLKEIYPFFRFNKDVIDFFLSQLIFPREAKGFPYKLSTSGWDIAERKGHNTTGFSGTNDNRYLLPTSINQLDLPRQRHTNSLVLTNILRPENNTVIKAHENDAKLTAKQILRHIATMTPKVQVLLDVGAQILELANWEVARTWLNYDNSPNILGAVFFYNDELMVMRREGRVEPFLSCALSKQLDRLLVYLDEAHTRGTDLKLPVGSRAAVTLGPNLPKDKFVQGCMRMRKLGNGHSLAFLVPPEIYAQIQTAAGKNLADDVECSDILLWTMLESCRQIHHGFSIWADQGFQYLKRKEGWKLLRANPDIDPSNLKDTMLDREALPLVEMYGVEDDETDTELNIPPCDDLTAIESRLEEFSAVSSRSVRVQEEQEREVDHEVEEETNVERPGLVKPRQPSVCKALTTIAQRGDFPGVKKLFQKAFSTFQGTSARDLVEIKPWGSDLYITTDCAETIIRDNTDDIDDYLRPVRWIVSLKKDSSLVLISPHEANALMKIFRHSRFCRLHCYAPRSSRNMRTLEHLDLCPVSSPALLLHPSAPDINVRMALNIFAGQLFFEDMEYYEQLCQFLGLYYRDIGGKLERHNDGWLNNETRSQLNLMTGSKFMRSPIPLIREIANMRRKGQGFNSTHLGRLLNAQELDASHFN
ncbi:hypothetical protein Dda_7903 [Drechslerella dactyloides]|uniref:ubiquitinyl hydrolase 1 n=1 Tax=Drechslerella dactyloides TaxID=74499 RepID=A0AAD6NG18_DREDA|nr:hypothetical protein Dda_7903 [Drechslerella dactyloides]